MSKIVQNLISLRERSESVKSVAEAVEIIKKIEEVLNPLSNGIGLAAVQIGIPKTVGVLKTTKKPLHLINPEIVSLKNEFVFRDESCLSLPGQFMHTKRYKDVIIKNHRVEDDKLREETLSFYYSPDSNEPGNDGLLAIAVQHEMEHFEGKLILDHDVRLEPMKREFEKVGRNDPCPCGSGKKHKKCCRI